MQHTKKTTSKAIQTSLWLAYYRLDTEGVALACFILVVALVALVDQISPGADLVVPNNLTIVLLVKILIIIDLVKAKSEASAYILNIKAIQVL